MKNIEIGSFVAEIKAKRIYENRNTVESASYLLNELSMVYQYAAKYMESNGYNFLAEDYNKKGASLYDMLTNLGFYEE